VTADNLWPEESCSALNPPDWDVVIEALVGTTPGEEGGFAADVDSPGPVCTTRDIPSRLNISVAEAEACVDQLRNHCELLGDPVPVAPAIAPAALTSGPESSNPFEN
jgi:hypothetical protein